VFLTATDLEELTGYRQRKRQVQWLTDNRIKFIRNRAGFPKVCQAEIDRIMIGGADSRKTQTQAPNFDLINA
jgi:hypothetical protein